jgi:hypothetical protein
VHDTHFTRVKCGDEDAGGRLTAQGVGSIRLQRSVNDLKTRATGWDGWRRPYPERGTQPKLTSRTRVVQISGPPELIGTVTSLVEVSANVEAVDSCGGNVDVTQRTEYARRRFVQLVVRVATELNC